MTAGIYSITCLNSGKAYIGSAVDIRRRWLWHKNALAKGRHFSRHLQSAWNLYGRDAFVFAVEEEVFDLIFLVAREQFWIWRKSACSNGYNSTECAYAPCGFKHTEAAKLKMSISKRGVPSPKKGIPMSAEQREKQRQIALARPKPSLETVAKSAAAHRGLKRSAETRQRMSEAAKRRIAEHPHTKPRRTFGKVLVAGGGL